MKRIYGTLFGSGPQALSREFKNKYDDIEFAFDENESIVEFCDNSVTTAKYNIISFLPRALFEQFRRVANLYFLFICCLMMIGTYTTVFDSPITPWSTLATLVVVMSISMGKEAIEDFKRHRADSKTNNLEAWKLNKISSPAANDTFHKTRWKDIRVGHIIKINNNEQLPADIVLLTTSEPFGTAFVETANIDGESNLKTKNSARTGSGKPLWSLPAEITKSEISIQCENPNSVIHSFQGSMFCDGREVGLDASSFMLRGSSLRNTKWAVGIVVYTGKETKLVMNSRRAPSKLSLIERTMNMLIYVIFLSQVVLSAISLVTYIVWKDKHDDAVDYLCYNYRESSNSLYRNACSDGSDYSDAGYFITFFILYNNFIPISLYVTVEVCNYAQAFFIDEDVRIYDEKSDTPALSRTSNMNSDLGMVEYIFSDKTGTLTDNIMNFKRCSIGGIVYGDPPDENEVEGGYDNEVNKTPPSIVIPNKRKGITGLPLENILSASGNMDTELAHFVLILALCHTVTLEEETGELQSESPDEDALVKAAVTLGWRFVGRTPGKVLVERDGVRASYDLLATIPFDSSRKRMSVVLRQPDGKVMVYCKGADNVIFKRAHSFADVAKAGGAGEVGISENSTGVVSSSPLDIMSNHMDIFAADGLRTLVLARRSLSEAEYKAFADAWDIGEKALTGRAELLAEAANLVENELHVVGATAIEDKLQKGVPSTIADLGKAGIKLMVLTGDKMETAINIGYSSRLLGPEMILIRLQNRGEDAATLKKNLRSLLNHLRTLAEDKRHLHKMWTVVRRSIYNTFFASAEGTSAAGVGTSGASSSAADAFDTDGSGGDTEDTEAGLRMDRNNTSAAARKQWLAETLATGESSGEQAEPLMRKPSPLSAAAAAAAAASVRHHGSPKLAQLVTNHLALIVDGDTLLKIFGDHEAEKMLLALAQVCKSVIACRVSPEQKRLMVRLVKKGIHPRPVTLAIGDGANDVAMIQEAQIGIGLSGKEGRQAVNSSDFAIAQFRFLKRLLLFHGRLDYRRTSKVVLYSFYKNIVLTMIIFLFTFYSAYSGQSMFDDNIYSAYNIVLCMPVLCFGIFDRDVSEHTLMHSSFMYISGRARMDLNVSNILYQMFQAAIDALIIFFIPYYFWQEPRDIWSLDGNTAGIWVYGTTVYTCLVVAMFMRCASITVTWTYLSILMFWGSFITYFAFLLAYQYMPLVSYNFYGVTNAMMGNANFYSLIVVTCVASSLVEVTLRNLQIEFNPTIVDIGTEYDRKSIDAAGGEFEPRLSPAVEQQQQSIGRTASVGAASPSYQAVPEEDAHSLAEEGPNRSCSNNNNNNANTRRRSDSGAGSDVDEDRELAEAEVIMGLSSELTSRPGESSDHTRYMLGWETMKNWFASLQPSELIRLNMSNSEQPRPRGDTFNYDHVSSSYGPGAGYTSDTDSLLSAANGGNSSAQTLAEDMSVNAATTTATSTSTSTPTASGGGVNITDGSGSGNGASGLRT